MDTIENRRMDQPKSMRDKVKKERFYAMKFELYKQKNVSVFNKYDLRREQSRRNMH